MPLLAYIESIVQTAVTRALADHGTPPPAQAGGQAFLTISAVAELLDVSRATADRLIREEGLPYVRIGSNKRIRRTDLEGWLNARAGAAA